MKKKGEGKKDKNTSKDNRKREERCERRGRTDIINNKEKHNEKKSKKKQEDKNKENIKLYMYIYH